MTSENSKPLVPLMLVAVRQLEAALEDASAETELLSRSIAALSERGVNMRDTGGALTHAKALPLVAEAQRAMRAMQYHDRLAQRIAHVRESLLQVHEAMASGAEVDWDAVGATIRSIYTMEDERRLFDELVLKRKGAELPAREESFPGVELF